MYYRFVYLLQRTILKKLPSTYEDRETRSRGIIYQILMCDNYKTSVSYNKDHFFLTHVQGSAELVWACFSGSVGWYMLGDSWSCRLTTGSFLHWIWLAYLSRGSFVLHVSHPFLRTHSLIWACASHGNGKSARRKMETRKASWG